MTAIELLTLEDIIEIHKEAIEVFGGGTGYYHDTENKIKSILDQQYPHFAFDKYPTPFEKAAMLWYLFTKNHCFVDGNKRVGFYAAATLLSINDIKESIDDDEAYDKAIEIIHCQHSGAKLDSYIRDLADWLRERTQRT